VNVRVCVSVYDVTSKQSFMKLDQWINELETHSTKHDIVTMLVGNKIDKVAHHRASPFLYYLRLSHSNKLQDVLLN